MKITYSVINCVFLVLLLSSFVSGGYYLDITAESINETYYENNDCEVTRLSHDVWRINNTKADYQAQRGSVLKVFYDNVVDYSSNVSSIYTQNSSDINRTGVKFISTGNCGGPSGGPRSGENNLYIDFTGHGLLSFWYYSRATVSDCMGYGARSKITYNGSVEVNNYINTCGGGTIETETFYTDTSSLDVTDNISVHFETITEDTSPDVDTGVGEVKSLFVTSASFNYSTTNTTTGSGCAGGGYIEDSETLALPVLSSPELIVSFLPLSPTNDTGIGSSQNLSFNLYHVDGVANCSLYVENVLKDSVDNLTNGSNSFLYDLSYGGSGKNLINISCTDATTTKQDFKTLYVDSVQPKIEPIYYIKSGADTLLSNADIYVEEMNFSVATNDTNNYLINITFTEFETGTVYYSNQTTNISSYYKFNSTINLTDFPYGRYNVTVYAADAHTKQKIDFKKELKDKSLFSITNIGKEIDNKLKTFGSRFKIKKFDLIQNKDRKKFDIEFYENIEEFTLTIEGKNKVDYVGDKYGYYGHFIVDNYYWYDLENEQNVKIKKIEKVNDKKYVVTMTKPKEINKVVFNSVGIINTNTESILFDYNYVEISNCSERGVPTLDFSFFDEITMSSLNTDYEISLEYTLDSDTVTLTQDSNSTNFSLCIFPNNAQVSSTLTMYYSATGYNERTYYIESQTLTNTTDYNNLYLLNNSEGAYLTFNVVDAYEYPLSGVQLTAEKEINGTTSIVESDTTDDAGVTQLFLALDDTYSISFSKIGYSSQTRSIRAVSSETYKITMQSAATSTNFSIDNGVSYTYDPKGLLNNGTSYNFTFNLTSSINNINDCDLYLYNGSTLLSSTAGTFTGSNCYANINYNTGLLSEIEMRAIYALNSTSVTKHFYYDIRELYEGDSSLKTLLEQITNFNSAGFGDFGRYALVLIIMLVVLFILSSSVGFVDAESYIIIFLVMLWAFSYIGWVTLPWANIPTIGGFDMQKYIIAIVLTLFVIGILIRRMK